MSATTSAEPGFATRRLGEIAATLPGATAVLRRHKLDFCCGGQATLGEVATLRGLSLDALEQELGEVAALARKATPPESTEELIGLIETRYHEAHRRELPELIRLARRVEAVHREHPATPAGLADLLETTLAELQDHMSKEEQVLFPLMRRGGHPMIAQPIGMMLAEHEDHGNYLRELERLTSDFTLPAEACSTWRALYAGGRKFADDLVEHIHTENNILFPRFTA
ncbi:MAG: iron-sulfur cluster repair di-iron protein [Rhodospirillales bacterium]|nr:iron-sulfur cluster repair di-iron protein [Rhodospirillales bacterium]